MTSLERIQEILSLKATEDGDCLIWNGRLSKSCGHPKYGDMVMRREVWKARKGPLKAGQLVTTTCGNPKCLEHLAITNKSEVARRSNADPRVKASKRVSAAIVARARATKLSMEKAREIRLSDESDTALAKAYGVDHSMISKVRKNRAWVESFSSPFAGLMA